MGGGGLILAFERGGAGWNTLRDPQKCTYNLGAFFWGGGVKRARKLNNALQIITRRFNDPFHRQNQQWPTSGPGGYITLAVWGGPQRFRAGDKIRSGP